MARTIIIAVLCLLLGGFVANSIGRYTAQQHQHTRSVMGLAQFHLARFSAAARDGQCASLDQERERLGSVYLELLQAFPLAYAQDAEFHARADALQEALQSGGSCPGALAQEKAIRESCDACHREYR